MLLISLVVHGLLLVVPMQSQPEPQPEPEPPKEEPVKITTLVAPSRKPSPKPAPKQTPKARKPSPKRTPRRVQPIPQPDVEPLPSLKPKEEPPEEPQPEEKQPQQSQQEDSQTKDQQQADTQTKEPQPDDNPTDNKQPDVNPNAGREAGQGLLEVLRPRVLERLLASTNDPDYTNEFLDSLPFGLVKDEQQQYFFAGQDQLMKGAVASLAIPQINSQTAYDEYIKPELEGLDFTIDPSEKYGGANLYKAKNTEGVEFYMSLVSLKLGSGAFVVIWAKDPRVEEMP
ncbi:MAG: hypothetical protein LDL41_23680 [Coleofasciculus sp. S288]|nr:hypothetical protein [Coleofasciculus sp. S288]